MDLHLLSAVQVAADTVVTLSPRDPVALAVDLAVILAALSVAVLTVVLVRLMSQFRRGAEEIRVAVRQNLGPVSDRARSISDDVQHIARTVRTDVERLNASVKALTARLHQASDRMEERIEEFNALMELVQSEAEDIFLDTAATVRGVREGARSIGRLGARPPGDPEEDDDELAAPEEDGGEAFPPGEHAAAPAGDLTVRSRASADS